MLNKKRLAALGLSAVMVASTASLPVSAADFSDGGIATQSDVVTDESEDFGVETNDDAQDSAKAAAEVDEASLRWDREGKKLYYKLVGVDKEQSVDITVVELQKATCQAGGKYLLTAAKALPGEKDARTEVETTAALIGHGKYHTTITRTVGGNCGTDTPSKVITYTHCSECDIDFDEKETEGTVPDHVIKNGTVTYELGANATQPSGKPSEKPVAIDKTQDAYYTEVTTGKCANCGNDATVRKPVTIKAEGVKVKSVMVSKLENIDSVKSDFKEGNYTNKEIPKNENIVLNDCDEVGSYVVTTTYTDETNDGGVKVTVPAHHVADKAKVEALDKADQKDLTAYYGEDGKTLVNVVNSNCTKDIKYKVTITCVANEKHVIKTYEATAAKSTTNHVLDGLKATVDAAKENETQLSDETVKALDAGKYTKIVPETATCDAAGTVSVEFYCQLCGAKAATVTGVNVGALGHKIVSSKENVVEATCNKEGSYDLVKKCERCGKETYRKKVIVDKLEHTNNKGDVKEADAFIKLAGNRVIVPKGTAAYVVGQTFEGSLGCAGAEKDALGKVSATVYTDCAVCHNNPQLLEGKTATITVTSIKDTTYNKVGELVAPGTIGLKATFTRADGRVVTAETSVMYFDKHIAEIPDEFKSGLEKDADGVYRYYVNGKFDSSFVGIAEYNGEKFFVTNGIMDNKASGLNSYDGKWYYLSEGRITSEYTGLVQFDGQWFYVVNGVMDTTKSGLVEYNGGTFLFIDGRKAAEVNGLWLDPTTDTWYFLALGQVQTQHTGVAMYDGEFFYIENGKLAKDFKGTVTYDGKKFNVVDGQLYGPIK